MFQKEKRTWAGLIPVFYIVLGCGVEGSEDYAVHKANPERDEFPLKCETDETKGYLRQLGELGAITCLRTCCRSNSPCFDERSDCEDPDKPEPAPETLETAP